jgi:hypothetical protein
MTELEQVLYESLARVSVPGDPNGVAGAIQARVDAGGSATGHRQSQATDDVGEPRDYLREPGANSSGNGSGFAGGGGAGIAPWLPWIGVLLVAAIVGGVTGASGLVGSPAPILSSVGISLTGGVDALDCPAGASVAKLGAGDRVLALKRSDDSAYLQVRNPYDVNQLVWLPAGVVVVDRGEASISSLPVGGCPKPALALDALPTQAPTEAPAPPAPGPAPAPKPTTPAITPPPAPDTTKPVISAGGWSPATVYGTHANQQPLCPILSTITVTASDNVGVSGVTFSSSLPAAVITQTSHSGNTYVFTFKIDYNNGTHGATASKVTFTAKDAAGNSAQVKTLIAVRSGDYTGCYGPI